MRASYEFLRAVMNAYVTHSSDVRHCIYANTGLVERHKHCRVILIAINFIIYKYAFFSLSSGFELAGQ